VRTPTAALVTALLIGPVGSVGAQTLGHYLVVKPGDAAATPQSAGGFLSAMSRWVEGNVPGAGPVEGLIANRVSLAMEYVSEYAPTFAFVPAGFYLGSLEPGPTPAEPVAQIPRFGADVERYYLVASSRGPESLTELRGATVRTLDGYDPGYLRRVVFSDGPNPGEDFRLEAAENLADELFYLLEDDPEGADALLLDEELKRFFEADDFVWHDLRVIWRSEPLPRDLVVALGEWSSDRVRALREALLSMGATPEGREILGLMQSEGFEPVDRELLDRAVGLYTEEGRQRESARTSGVRHGLRP